MTFEYKSISGVAAPSARSESFPRSLSSTTYMASIIPVFLVLVVAAALMTASALFVPKGPNQMYVYGLCTVDGH